MIYLIINTDNLTITYLYCVDYEYCFNYKMVYYIHLDIRILYFNRIGIQICLTMII